MQCTLTNLRLCCVHQQKPYEPKVNISSFSRKPSGLSLGKLPTNLQITIAFRLAVLKKSQALDVQVRENDLTKKMLQMHP